MSTFKHREARKDRIDKLNSINNAAAAAFESLESNLASLQGALASLQSDLDTLTQTVNSIEPAPAVFNEYIAHFHSDAMTNAITIDNVLLNTFGVDMIFNNYDPSFGSIYIAKDDGFITTFDADTVCLGGSFKEENANPLGFWLDGGDLYLYLQKLDGTFYATNSHFAYWVWIRELIKVVELPGGAPES